MANVLKHRFVSAKSDGPDATQIQPSNWNDGHAFTGGNAGDVLTRDPTDANFGATWAPAATVTNVTGSSAPILPADRARHFLLLNSPSDTSFHGAVPASGSFAIGTRMDLLNVGPGAFLMVPLSTSIATGRLINFAASTYATQLVGTNSAGKGSAAYVWNGSYWVMVAHEQGGPFGLGFTNANLVGFTATLNLQDFYLHGRDVHIRIVANITVPAQVGVLRFTGWNWKFSASGGGPLGVMTISPTHSGWGPDFALTDPDNLYLYLSTSAPWPAGSWNAVINLTVPID